MADYLKGNPDLTMSAEQKDELVGDITQELEAIAKAIQNLRRGWMVAEFEQRLAEYEAALAEYNDRKESGADMSDVPVPPEPRLQVADIDCNLPIHTLEQEAADLVMQARITVEAETQRFDIPIQGGLPAMGEDQGAPDWLPMSNEQPGVED